MGIAASALDLFCGVGGMTRGLIDAGINVIAGIDSDESCRYAYETNNNSRFIHKDIKLVTADEIRGLYPSDHVKVLVGCAPCQPFSTHTQKIKERQQDEKWSLLQHFGRLINELQPEIISMENVVRIMSQDVFSEFLNSLEGYHEPFYKSIPCVKYGVPQIRRRLVLLASRLGKINLIEPTHEPENYVKVKDTLNNLEALEEGDKSHSDLLHRTLGLNEVNLRRIRASKPGGTWLDWDEDLRAECHRKAEGQSYKSVYARMSWDEPAPTVTTQFYNFGTGRFGHPEQDRGLSLREGALLQTFPPDYDFIDPEVEISFRRLGTHIGNAVPVRLAQAVGKSIIAHLKEHGYE